MQATEIAEAVNQGRMRAVEVVEAALDRIEAEDKEINAFISLNPEALAAARMVDERVQAGERLPLAGVPLAVKDNLAVKGLAATAGSRILENFKPPYTATAVARLVAAGAVVVGKTNLDEFGMGSSTEYSAFGPTKNPRDPSRVPGGSSGGSAAAVAAGMVPLALGSDTGGSIRQPAAFTGVLGFKPTYGLVSRYGLIAYASSLDTVGPLAGSVRDLALALALMAGPDPMDATSIQQTPELWPLPPLPAKVRIGHAPALVERADPGVRAAFSDFLKGLADAGYVLVELDLEPLAHALPAYYLVATSEASSNLARYDGTLYGLRVAGADLVDTTRKTRARGFGPEVKRRILMGTFALSSGYYEAYYERALRLRRKIAAALAEAFRSVEALLLPTAPTPAFKLGERLDDPLSMYLSDLYTVAANLAGIPALSLPVGSAEGLPVGAQLLGPALADGRLLSLAARIEVLGRIWRPD